MHRLPGQIQAKQQVNVNSSVNSSIKQIFVKNGQQVKQGDPIIHLDDQTALEELQRLQAQQQERLASADILQTQQQLDIKLLTLDQQQLANSQANLKREMALVNKQLSTNSRIEQAQAEVARARQAVLSRQMSIDNHSAQSSQMQAQLQQIELALTAAQRQLQQLQISADFDGIVANLNGKIDQQVSIGQALFTLYNAEQLYFHTEISQQLAQQANPEIEFQQQRHPLSSINPWLQSASSGQTAVFALNTSDALINSFQYAYWISPPVTDSFLLTKRALFDFERVYYLKALDTTAKPADNNQLTEVSSSSASSTSKVRAV